MTHDRPGMVNFMTMPEVCHPIPYPFNPSPAWNPTGWAVRCPAMKKPRKKAKGKQKAGPISLHPFTVEQAVRGLLAAKPEPPKGRRKPRPKT